MTPLAKAIKFLRSEGFVFDRHGANHDLYYNVEINDSITLKRHSFNENDLKYIVKEVRQKKIKYEEKHGL